MEPSILAGRDRISLGNGMTLRLLSALELLQARREATELCREHTERALYSNACLLARVLEDEQTEQPVFSDPTAVLAGLTVEEISALAARWGAFHQQSNPGLQLSSVQLEEQKKNSAAIRLTDCAGVC